MRRALLISVLALLLVPVLVVLDAVFIPVFSFTQTSHILAALNVANTWTAQQTFGALGLSGTAAGQCLQTDPSTGLVDGTGLGCLLTTVINTWTAEQDFKNVNKILYANQFSGGDLGAQTNAAIAALSGNPGTIVWTGGGTISTPIAYASHVTISCQGGTYTETGGGATPTAIEMLNGVTDVHFEGQGNCLLLNHQTPAYSGVNNAPSSAFVVTSQTIANADVTSPDVSTVLTADCLVGSTSCSVTSLTGLFAGQDVVIGSTRGDGAYQISPSWNGSNPVVFTRPMDDSYTVAHGAFVGYFTNGFTRDWSITGVTIIGTSNGTEPAVGHGLFIHNAFYGRVQNVSAYLIGGRVAVANGYSAFLDYDHIFFDATNAVSTDNGFEPCYVLTSHCRASNSTVVDAPANCLAIHGYHQQFANMQGYGCGESGLQLDTLEDFTDVGSHYANNGTNGINIAGSSSNEQATDIDLNGDTVNNNANDGVSAGIGGNVRVKIRGLTAYNNAGNTASDGGDVFFDGIQAGSMVVDSLLCGGARGIYLDGSNSYLVFSNLSFSAVGICAANSVGDFVLRTSSGALTNSFLTNLTFGATQPISSANCTTLSNDEANTIWGLNNLGSQCSASSGIITQPSSITWASQGMTISQLNGLTFAATGNPGISVNGATDALVIGGTPGATSPGPLGATAVGCQSGANPRTEYPSGGAFWWCGVADPSGSCQNGDLFTNTSGAAGHIYWGCKAGTWADIY